MAVSLSLLAGAGWQFFDDNGNPLSGGLLYTYEAGTTTPLATYTDSNGNVANANPIVLDAAGRVPYQVWLDTSATYKFVLTTSLNITVWTEDNVEAAGVSAASLAASSGSSLIGFLQSGTGAVARTVQGKLRDTASVFDFMTAAQIADVQAGTLLVDVTAAVQAAINASYGRKLFFPRGAYRITSTLTVQVYANAGVNNLGVHLQGEAMGPISGTLSGTRLCIVGAINGINVNNSTAQNGDARIIIEDMLIYGDGTNAAGGSGIIANLSNNMLLRNLFIQDFRNHGIYLYRCFGSSVEDCTILRCRAWGIWANEAFNLGNLRRVRVYGCGRSYSSDVQGSIYLSGAGNENLGVIIEDVDVSYAGTSAYQLFQRSDSTLTNIVVNAGVATATTASAHGLLTGNLISVVGATADAALNTIYPPAVTATGATTFTFATSAGNGTYTESTLTIGPAAYGFLINYTRGLVLHGYAEDCIGPSMLIGSTTTAFDISGGYWQGTQYGCVVINDSATNGSYGAMYFNGQFARMYLSNSAGPNAVNFRTSNVFASGAQLTRTAPQQMTEGVYYASAAPTTGTWSVGDRVVRNPPVVGQPKAWTCTVAGTPGTWVSEGNL